MEKRTFYPFVVFAVLLATTLACSLPGGGQEPASNEDQVSTVVAATMQASTPDSPAGETSTPAGLLPHSLYFLNNDNTGISQVFRLETDGTTVRQITSESQAVESFDVSRVDGGVAYVAGNQLLFIGMDGSGRHVLVSGEAVDENNPYLTKVSNPVFSPDGGIIAYNHKGLSLYIVSTGAIDLVIEDQWNEVGSGLFIPSELYWPERYSLDGTKLLITLGYYEGASTAIYYPQTGALTRLSGGEGSIICCGDYHLSDDASVLYAASPHMGMFSAGLWRVDIPTGVTTTLLAGTFDSNPADVADNPFLAPDGQLYFFYASVPNTEGFIDRAPLQLVRSAPDGVTGRIVLRPETFANMSEALWAPDASFVIVTLSDENFQGREAQLVYTDGRPIATLLSFAQELRWGP